MSIEATFTELVAPRQLVFESEEIDPGALDPDQILCRTEYTAISPGTELAAFEGVEPLRPTLNPYPRLVGYLNAARVIEVGSTVTDHAVGDHVLTYTSHRSHFVVPTEKVMAVIPDGVDPRDATLAHLFRLALCGLRRGGLGAGAHVAVVGLGVIGLCAVRQGALAKARVHAVSAHPDALDIARRFGAAYTYDKVGGNTVAAVEDNCRGGVDLVVTTSNAWADWELALALPRFNGIISVLGFPGRGSPPPSFNPLASRYLYDRQLTITSAGMSPPQLGLDEGDTIEAQRKDLAEILGQMAAGALDPRPLIAGVFEARNLASAYETLSRRRTAPGTFLIEWP